MILLTDEEIFEAMRYKAGTTTFDRQGKNIAKAQLKKVVELLKSCDGELVSRKEGPFMATFEMLATDYQALLEEVK